MKQLTVCIDDGLQGEVVYRAEISHTEEDYQELKSDLEFVREENKKLKEENKLLKQCLDKLMFDADVVNVKIHGELGDYVYVRRDKQFKLNVKD